MESWLLRSWMLFPRNHLLVAIVGSCMFLRFRQAAMPITLPKYDPHDRYMVVCLPLQHQRPGLHNRHVAIFLEGYFDLGEATKFVHAVKEMDRDPPPKEYFFQRHRDTNAFTFAWSTHTSDQAILEGLQYLIDNYQALEFMDAYSYHVLLHTTLRVLNVEGNVPEDGRTYISEGVACLDIGGMSTIRWP